MVLGADIADQGCCMAGRALHFAEQIQSPGTVDLDQ